MMDVRETLLKLPAIEKNERKKVKADYYFYKGKSINLELAKADDTFLGQSWITNDNVDYIPTQDIRNKVKTLLKKQARFMFGKEPGLILKPDNSKEKDLYEELRMFLDNIFETNHFWKNTRKAFLMSTIKKRVLLRAEANPDMPIAIKYENIEDFYYKEQNGMLLQVWFFEEDEQNAFKDSDTDKIYYIHTYYYDKEEEKGEISAFYKMQTFKGDDLKIPTKEKVVNTGFNTIPCWLIVNGGELGDGFGESDVDDLRESQNQYNRKNSDYADALKFQMFGSEAIIDGDPDDVSKLKIAPNALHAIKTEEQAAENNKQATMQRLEYNFGSAEAANAYLDRIDKDMRDSLDMPTIKDLSNIPSAKAMKYLYNDLITRCEEKWSDWGPVLKDLIDFIIQAAQYSYKSTFKKEWLTLNYTLLFKHNYPLPSDEEDKKKLAIEEVNANVRSHKSYIKDYSDEEDAKAEFKSIVDELVILTEAEADPFSKSTVNEGNNTGGEE